MRKFQLATLVAAFVFSLVAIPALSQGNGAVIVMSGDEKWVDGTGPMKGVQVATLSGDPAKVGSYIVRVKVPPNTTLGAHYHGDSEDVTILSGTLYVGLGDKVDQSKLTALGAGAFAHLDKAVHHYAVTKDDGAVIQISGTGPMTMTMVGEKKM